MCVSVLVCAVLWKSEEGIKCPGVGVRGGLSHPALMLRTERQSSVREASALNPWASYWIFPRLSNVHFSVMIVHTATPVGN